MSAPEPPPYNPYTAPAAPGPSVASTSRGLGSEWKWAYLVVSSVMLSGLMAYYWSGILGLSPEAVEVTGKVASSVLPLVRLLIAIGWIQAAWTGVPARWRREITPGRAVGLLFVPVYNIYWMFALNQQLCERIDEGLRAVDDHRRAPGGLAMIAATTTMASTLCGWVARATPSLSWLGMATIGASTAAWFAYMFACDPVRARVAEIARGLPEEPRAPSHPQTAGLKMGCMLPLAFLLFLLVIAIWQFLAPAARHH